MLTALVLSLALGAAATGPDPRPPSRADPEVDTCPCPALSSQLRAFDRLDRDGDGVLTSQDTRRRYMGRDRGRGRLDDPLQTSLDIDGDGRATRAELTDATDCPGKLREVPQR